MIRLVAVSILTMLLPLYVFLSPHPGGFYAEVVATGYGVKILNVDNSHVSPDKLSSATKIYGNVMDTYAINYTLKTKGMTAISVNAPSGIEIAFKPQKIWLAEIKLGDGYDPALYAKVGYSNGTSFYIRSEAKDFKIYAYSNGEYDVTNPSISCSESGVKLNNTTYSCNVSRKIIDSYNYVGWQVNFTLNLIYINSTANQDTKGNVTYSVTILVNKNGKEAIMLVNATTYVYRSADGSSNSMRENTFIKILVNTTGTYAWKNGNLAKTSSATTIKVKGINGIWDGSSGTVLDTSVDGTLESRAVAEIGNITISIKQIDSAKIEYVYPGLWILSNNIPAVNLTMYIYPHPIASGYREIFVQFSKL